MTKQTVTKRIRKGSRKQVESALSKYYSKKFNGKVWASWDESKRAYEIRGEGLPAHPDMQAQYPNGWSLLDWDTPSKARELVGLTAAADVVNPKSRRIIVSVKLKRMVDDSPDTSWLGEYSDKPTTEFSIDRQHTLDCQSQTFSEKPNDEENNADTHNIDIEYARACGGTCADCGATPDECERKPCEYRQPECDCGERGTMERGTYRYFNPGSVESFQSSASWIPATVVGEPERREYWRKAMQENARADYARSEAMNRGEFCFVGIRAVADVIVGGKIDSQTGLIQTISSGGLWGVESDSGDDHFAEVEGEQLAELRGQLVELGFSRRAIAAAFKKLVRVGDGL